MEKKLPFNGYKDPYDMGWAHGTEDCFDSWKHRPDIPLNHDEFEEYKDGYKDARRGWN